MVAPLRTGSQTPPPPVYTLNSPQGAQVSDFAARLPQQPQPQYPQQPTYAPTVPGASYSQAGVYPPQQHYATAPSPQSPYNLNDNFGQMNFGGELRPDESASNVGGSDVGASTLGRTSRMTSTDQEALKKVTKAADYLDERIQEFSGPAGRGINSQDFAGPQNRMTTAFSTLAKDSEGTPRMKMFAQIAATSAQNLKPGKDLKDNASLLVTAKDTLAHGQELFKEARQIDITNGKLQDLPNIPYRDGEGSENIGEALTKIAAPSQSKSLFTSQKTTQHKEAVGDFQSLNKMGDALRNHFKSPAYAEGRQTSYRADNNYSQPLQVVRNELNYLNKRVQEGERHGISKSDFDTNIISMLSTLQRLRETSGNAPLLLNLLSAIKDSANNLPSSMFKKQDNQKNFSDVVKALNTATNLAEHALRPNPQRTAANDIPNIPVKIGNNSPMRTGDALTEILKASGGKSDKKEAIQDLKDLNTLGDALLNHLQSRS